MLDCIQSQKSFCDGWLELHVSDNSNFLARASRLGDWCLGYWFTLYSVTGKPSSNSPIFFGSRTLAEVTQPYDVAAA